MSTEGPPASDSLTDLDDLTVAGQVLLALADEVPDPHDRLDLETLYFALLGTRAPTLYKNFLHSLSSPAPLGPILAVRPLIELAVLSKWMSLNPELHGNLWMADSEASELTHIRYAIAHMKVRGSEFAPPDPSQLEPKEEVVREAKQQLAEAGRKYGNRVMPSVIRMVEEVEKAVPGHRIAVRDAYDLAYRPFSPWEHTDASSYRGTVKETGPDTYDFLGDLSPFKQDHIHAIGASMLAYTLEVVLTQTKNDNASIARWVRDYITKHWAPEARKNPKEDP